MRIRKCVLDAMVAHARQARPSECCGVLLGNGDEIIEAVPTRNIAGEANRFFVDPKEHIEARRDGRRRGLHTIGFYHSHPASPAVPSATDLAEASYPDHFYGIVSLARDPADVRIYSFEDGAFREVPFVTVP